MSNLNPLEVVGRGSDTQLQVVVGRGSDTQLQVSENLNKVNDLITDGLRKRVCFFFLCFVKI